MTESPQNINMDDELVGSIQTQINKMVQRIGMPLSIRPRTEHITLFIHPMIQPYLMYQITGELARTNIGKLTEFLGVKVVNGYDPTVIVVSPDFTTLSGPQTPAVCIQIDFEQLTLRERAIKANPGSKTDDSFTMPKLNALN